MKKTIVSLLIFLASLPVYGADGRESIGINREWMYLRGNAVTVSEGIVQDSFSPFDKGECVNIPHSFSIPYFLSKDFYVGYGWYGKRLLLTAADLKKRLFLEFDGAFQETEVFVNGRLTGSHRGGYTGFSIDMTPYAKVGSNTVAVRVNNLWQATLAPRGGEHVFSGGIYRNVRLVKKNRVHIPWCATAITTPGLQESGGRSSCVRVQTAVANSLSSSSKKGAKVTVRIIVADARGNVVVKASQEQTVRPSMTAAFDITTPQIDCPLLWSPDTPNLYTVRTQVEQNGGVIDEESVQTGFRWFEWTADKGFFLNGKHYYFRGANVHQDQAGWGDAVTDSAACRDVKLMKQAGFNMIRGSHYPHSPAFVEACDREGMLFWSEAPFWSTAGPKDDGAWTASAYPVNPNDTAAFEASALQQLEEMILIHRNHPSVFVWSMCNEPFFTDGRTLPGVRRLLKRMVDRTHSLDPTRKAAIGGAQRPLGNDRIDLTGDVAGYNGDGANIADFQMPPVPSVVSEYGSTTADRPGKYTPGWGDLNRDEGWKGRPWRSGQAIWCGFDHGSIFGDDLGKMGIVDYFRLPKQSWYWYRNEYAKLPPPEFPKEGTAARLRLTASKTNGIKTDGTDDVHLIVSVLDSEGRELSNSPDVELRIVAGPGEFPTGKTISFSKASDIRILDGKAAIALRSYYAGATVVEAVSEGLASARIELSFVGDHDYVEGVSRETVSRPYIRYEKGKTADLQDFGLNNPTFATSSSAGHSAGFAADGNAATYWQPSQDDNAPTWTLDTERGLFMHSLEIDFAEAAPCHYLLEVSAAGSTWQRIHEAEAIAAQRLVLPLPTPLKMRFLRLTVVSGTLKVAEVKVRGIVL